MTDTDDPEIGRDARDPGEWPLSMRGAQDANRTAYRRLLIGVTPFVRALASRSLSNRSDVEDAVQDILMTVHTIRHTYDPSRPFKPWLAGVAHHRLVDKFRAGRRIAAREVAMAPEHETFSVAEPNTDTGAWDGPALRAALGALPDGQRRAIELTKLKEMSLKEASAATGMSIAALKVATHRGLAALRRLLREKE